MSAAKENPTPKDTDRLLASLSEKDRLLYRDYGLKATIRKVMDGKYEPGVFSCLMFNEHGELIQVGAFIQKDGSYSVQPWGFSTDVSL